MNSINLVLYFPLRVDSQNIYIECRQRSMHSLPSNDFSPIDGLTEASPMAAWESS